MTIGQAGAERFYRIWWPLLKFVNRELGIVPDLRMRPSDGALQVEQAMLLRNALWEDELLRERFVATNPGRLSAEDLGMVLSWSHRLAGNFFIIRYLKRHTVFLDDTSRFFGVLGLFSPINEILGQQLPLFTEAVLLPFEGRIIIDGILKPRSVTFGSGIRQSLEDSYREARQGRKLINSFDELPAV
jgi:hypothetical protein